MAVGAYHSLTTIVWHQQITFAGQASVITETFGGANRKTGNPVSRDAAPDSTFLFPVSSCQTSHEASKLTPNPLFRFQIPSAPSLGT
ncbi:unnamed protein product [[Candida] boidinii]|uniref:Unnamed protein product n=1 Tax=Candida boidinii TaxID=5477 RepID=A0A9W6SWE2_CANBO|nr:unnamed protein product [[Candida] boidinii]GMF98403.1 unnamed protein product [[Candida] boidinii]